MMHPEQYDRYVDALPVRGPGRTKAYLMARMAHIVLENYDLDVTSKQGHSSKHNPDFVMGR